MRRLAQALAAARERRELALIPRLTAGDPDPETTRALASMLVAEGADILELHVPFSDPLPDGATIRGAEARALAAGMTLSRGLDLAQEIRRDSAISLIVSSHFNPICRIGLSGFAQRAAHGGVDGVVVRDLPPEEGEEYRQALSATGLDPIFTLAPSSGAERVRLVAQSTRGLIYYIGQADLAAAGEEIPRGLRDEVSRIRLTTSIPVAVDCGASRLEHLRALSGAADGAVISSPLVRWMEGAPTSGAAVEAVRRGLGNLLGRVT
jgi:tryptophan synthase alpha chain